MTEPICEEMTSQPALAGMDMWGVIDPHTGEFEGLYPISQGAPYESALYWLAAAGICDIRGQDRVGDLAPNAEPVPIPVPDAGRITAVASPAESIPHPVEQVDALWPWAIGLALLVIIGGAAVTRSMRNTTDKTPPPEGFTFNGGADHGNG